MCVCPCVFHNTGKQGKSNRDFNGGEGTIMSCVEVKDSRVQRAQLCPQVPFPSTRPPPVLWARGWTRRHRPSRGLPICAACMAGAYTYPLRGSMIDICATLQQKLDELLVAVAGGEHQERTATHAVILEPCVDSPTVVEPQPHRADLASRGRRQDVLRYLSIRRRRVWRAARGRRGGGARCLRTNVYTHEAPRRP